ncbi:MAG: ParB/RepB/Spo0J family partition protein [Chloroflexota bacterium]
MAPDATSQQGATTGAKRRKALGRGLDVLMPATERSGLQEIDLDRIEPNPHQPRQYFEPQALEELAASIREHGIVQPLVVAGIGDDRYRLVIGERRWRASQLAGLERVPVVVKDASDQETLEIALVENLQRADLNPLEEAQAYQRLTKDFGLTQQEVARQVGKSRAAVANTLRLLSLSPALKDAVIGQRISEGHARALLGLQDEIHQNELLERVEQAGLTVRQTEEAVRHLLEAPRRATPAVVDPNVEALETDLRRALGTKVSLRHGAKGGRIVIEYYSDEEFQGLYDRLTGTPTR